MRPVSKQENYLKSKVSHLPPYVDELECRLLNDEKWGINLSPAEGAFLRFIVEIIKPHKIVEIGTQYGYSSHWLIDSNVETLELYTLERQKDHFEVANEYFSKLGSLYEENEYSKTYSISHKKKIQSILGEATNTLPLIEEKGPFDMVFIDANKGGYLEYLEWSIKNLNSGGWIVADNTFLFGSVWLDEPGDKAPKNPWIKMREFNNRLSDSSRFRSFMLPTPEGLSIAQII